jgi:hypothetical protein
MYYLICRSHNRKSSDYVLARSMKKDREEIEQLLIEYRDKHGFNKDYIKLYIKKV